MRLIKYIWRNVTRNKLRSMLTILSVGFSMALMTVLYGYMALQQRWGEESKKHDRLVVMNTQGFSGLLPIAYVNRVRRLEGVVAATQYSWFGGNYKDEAMPFAQFGADPQSVFNVWSEFKIDSAQLKAWQSNRRGCVVERRLAERRGWQIGERIPLKGTFYPVQLDLELVGVYDAPLANDSLWFDWYYLDELLRQTKQSSNGNSGTIFLKTASATAMPTLSEQIDAQFASSNNPTRTQTEEAFAQMFTDMLGNVQAYIRNIGLAIVFSLSLVAANAMAMSARERTTEIAVLKAIGFSRPRVLMMILGEACAIAVLGGMLGTMIGCACLQGLHMLSPQFFPFGVDQLPLVYVVGVFAVSAGIGFVSGIVPAVGAARLSVVDGLRRVV